MDSAITGKGTGMSAQASTLKLEVRHTHRTWYASVAVVVIAAVVAIVLMIARTGPTSSAGTGTSTHGGPAVTQVGSGGDYQFKPLP